MKPVFILGHKNPDTDSICSALAYAALRNRQHGTNRYIPGRIGEISQETAFVLSHFGIQEPVYVKNLKAQVSDLNLRKISPVSPEISLKRAWQVMQENQITTLAISRDGVTLDGMVTIGDLARSYLDPVDSHALADACTPYANMLEVLDGELVAGDPEGCYSTGHVLVGAMNPERMEQFLHPGDAIILGNRMDNQWSAIEIGAGLMILTGGSVLDPAMVKRAASRNCAVIQSPYDTFKVAHLVNQSLPVKHVMKVQDLVTFEMDDYLDETREVMAAKRYRNFPVVNEDGTYAGLISRALLLNLQRKAVILVDHNERSQAVDGLEEAEILEIIDHHRIGDIQTSGPVIFRNQPVGCTATLIAGLYQEAEILPDKSIAGALCAAILSDTLMFKSPTCTALDRQTAMHLASEAGIDAMQFAREMFRAGSKIRENTAEELFYQDFKRFSAGKLVIGVGQITSMDMDELQQVKIPLKALMKKKIDDDKFNLLLFMLTDIAREGTLLLCIGESGELISRTFGVKPENQEVYLPGVVSRKKQIIPPLLNSIYQGI